MVKYSPEIDDNRDFRSTSGKTPDKKLTQKLLGNSFSIPWPQVKIWTKLTSLAKNKLNKHNC